MPVYKKYDRDFFKRWSKDMAYILGFLYADGNITKTKRGTHFISAYSADRNLLIAFKKVMSFEHKISKRNSSSGCVFRFQIGSREYFDDLGRIGLTPNKTKRMFVPKIPNDFLPDFIRGYFDGDGNVWCGYMNKKRVKKTKVLSVSFTSGSKMFLKKLLDVLRQNGVKGGSIFDIKNKNYSRISLSTLDSLILYKFMYNGKDAIFLNRKKSVFERFIKMRV